MDLHRVLQQIQYPDDTSGGRSERQKTDLQERAAEVDSGQPPTVRCIIIVQFKCCIHWWGTLKPQLCKLPNTGRSWTTAKEKYSLTNWRYLEKVVQKKLSNFVYCKKCTFVHYLIMIIVAKCTQNTSLITCSSLLTILLYNLTSRTQTSTSLVGPRSSFEPGRLRIWRSCAWTGWEEPAWPSRNTSAGGAGGGSSCAWDRQPSSSRSTSVERGQSG